MAVRSQATSPAFILLFCACSAVRGAESPAPRLPPRLKQVLNWLPADSETLIVANGPAPIPRELTDDRTFLDSVRLMPASIFVELQDGLLRKELHGQTVQLAVEASRRFRSPQGLGMMPYEGCEILLFDDSADEALRAAVEKCLQVAPRTLELVGTKVATFTEKSEQDNWSLFVARPQHGVLLCATDEKFLEQVLTRMQGEAKDRAFPDELPEWEHVNVEAQAWAIRHFREDFASDDPSSPLVGATPADASDAKASGITFWIEAKEKGTAKVRYLTSARNGLQIASIRWNLPSEKLAPAIKEIKPGVVEISTSVDDESEGAWTFLFVLMWYLGHGVIV